MNNNYYLPPLADPSDPSREKGGLQPRSPWQTLPDLTDRATTRLAATLDLK